MADLNNVCLIGRLTRQAEIRYSQGGGGAVVRFSIAVNRRKRSADGNSWEEEANFFDCVYFGRAAESVNQYLEKGRQVSISGELRQNRWEQDGQSRSKVEIVVGQLNFLGSRSDNAGGGNNSAYYEGGSSRQASYAQAPQYANGPQQGGMKMGDAAPSNQNRFSGNFSRTPQQETVSNDYGLGPESYGDDDVPF